MDRPQLCVTEDPAMPAISRNAPLPSQSGFSAARRADFRPRVEALECRQLLSGGPVAPLQILQVSQTDPHATYQTIQAAVDAARPGDQIEIFAGTYDAFTVHTPGLTLFGAPGADVIIQNKGQTANGVTVTGVNGAPLSGFTLKNVTVNGFTDNGVFLDGVNGFVLSGIRAVNNGEYGLFPVRSSNGLIELSSALGSNDAGIYVGQARNVLVRGNVAAHNVNGIEIENSIDVTTTHNTVFDNTVGILEDMLPGFTRAYEQVTRNVISDNLVMRNNKPNTAPADDLASLEMPGTGIAVIGSEHTTVRGNTVFGNGYAGIAVLSGSDLVSLAHLAGMPIPSYLPGVNFDPTHTLVQNNHVSGNGFATGPLLPGFPAPGDLIWTGTGSDNHWINNSFGTSTPNLLP
jgi:parallel beta-helix repeat protein